jgi:hypothetical protein
MAKRNGSATHALPRRELLLTERLAFAEHTLAVVKLRVDATESEEAFVATIEERGVVTLRWPSRSVWARTGGLQTLNLEFEDPPQAS